ncbi:glycerophosphoryl diester phosphodiesterase [Gottschalkia purinilytica]|uniref:Glycerophosphoryl diester phosphodiesterase n=1 Tax=Gottschalkia purinilytica TaxID=1503 RepID=A0A0L0WDH8_GOTPU|nr:glycerophosphodiester phosphodiesterase [Gottschalkia purinilytica]KNF09491.1 glycerophosphoryl diester phosphodiesterase [Gottschalkia purinilytica]
MKKPLIIAHRGASAYAPENTISSFKKAIEMKSDGIELDVQMTKDNEIVVCHDEMLNRTTNGVGYIKDLTLKEIKALDAGSWYNEKYKGEKIPTLEEVFEIVKDKNILINIELKNIFIHYDGLEEKVVDLIQKKELTDNVIISSFNYPSLIEIKKINRKIKVAPLYMFKFDDLLVHAKRINSSGISMISMLIDDKFINDCKDNGFNTYFFTINDRCEMMRVLKKGVSGILTDYPDVGVNLLKEL